MIKISLSGVIKNAMQSPDGENGGKIPDEITIDEIIIDEIYAKDINQLLNKLLKTYPKLDQYIEQGVSVSINGEIYNQSLFQKIPPNADVVLIPRLSGG